jgi:predicted GNAT family acetyltransferase
VNFAPDPVIADHPEAQRYEVHLGEILAGYADYRARPGLIAFIHTEIRDRFEGQGLGGRLVAFALEDARERGLDVLPFCPFVGSYLQRHPEYVDLVPQVYRKSFDL